MKKYYTNKDGNYCSYNYIPSFTEEDGMTEISEAEYSAAVAHLEAEYYAEKENEATEADYIAALERFGVE